MSAPTSGPARTRGRTRRRPQAPARSQRPAPLGVGTATLFMVVCASYFLVPLWWLLVASSRDRASLADGDGLWFAQPFELFANIQGTVTYDDHIFLRWAFNSVIYSGVGAALGTLFAAMAGYALAKFVFPGREAVFNVILAGVLVPATALALPLFLLFSGFGQADTMWAVLLPSLVSPFGVYLARIYAASSVPDELLEAARIDGASEFRTFFTVSTRLMVPALVTIFLFQFVAVWNNFFLPLVMLQSTDLYPLTLGLHTWNSQVTHTPQLQLYVIVGSLLSVVPLVIAFLSLQRFWRGGLADGGVK